MRNRLPIAISATLLSVGTAGASYAQSAPAGQNIGLEEIVVTARRREERLQDVPISITVFNQEELTDRRVVTANELARYTPSLQTNARFGTESASFSIRGFVQENQTSPSVAVYFADVTAPRAQGGTTAGNGAGPGYFFDLQNVQVLKGPQGTLFGYNTTGGAVLLVPQKPTAEFGGYVEGTAGDYGLLREQGALNLPISETFRVRLGVDHQERDGYLHNVSGIGPKDFADVGYTAVRLSAVWDITENLENYTIASYSRSNTNGFYPKIVNQDNGPSAGARNRDPFSNLRAAQIAATSHNYWDVSNGFPGAFQTTTNKQLINTTTWTATDTLTIKNIASYAQFVQDQGSNIYGENGYQNGTTIPYYAVNIVPQPGSDNTSQQTWTEELQLQGRTNDDRFTYQAGVYYEKSSPLNGFQATYSANSIACTNIAALQCQNVLKATTPAAGTLTAGFIQNSRTKYNFEDLGIYSQGTFKFTDKLSLTAGIRYTEDKTEGLGQVLKISYPPPAGTPVYGCAQPPGVVTGGTSAQVLANPDLCDFRRKDKSSAPTWLVDFDFKPTDDMLLYAKYARGYRQGGVNVSSYGLETWKDEQVDLYEIGTKTSWQGAAPGGVDLAIFYNNFTNQQIAINTLPCNLVAATPGFPTTGAGNFPSCVGFPLANSPSPAQGIGNGGKSTIKGAEIDAHISPFTGLKIDVAYAYLDTKLKSITVPPPAAGFASYVPNAIVGGPLQNTPKNKYSATVSYTLPLSEGIGHITPSATYTYQSTAFGNNSSVTLKTLPSQKNLNLNLNWTDVVGKPIDVGLFVTNVNNEKYYVFATGASFGWDAVVLNEPRMWGGRVKYRFGN